MPKATSNTTRIRLDRLIAASPNVVRLDECRAQPPAEEHDVLLNEYDALLDEALRCVRRAGEIKAVLRARA